MCQEGNPQRIHHWQKKWLQTIPSGIHRFWHRYGFEKLLIPTLGLRPQRPPQIKQRSSQVWFYQLTHQLNLLEILLWKSWQASLKLIRFNLDRLLYSWIQIKQYLLPNKFSIGSSTLTTNLQNARTKLPNYDSSGKYWFSLSVSTKRKSKKPICWLCRNSNWLIWRKDCSTNWKLWKFREGGSILNCHKNSILSKFLRFNSEIMIPGWCRSVNQEAGTTAWGSGLKIWWSILKNLNFKTGDWKKRKKSFKCTRWIELNRKKIGGTKYSCFKNSISAMRISWEIKFVWKRNKVLGKHMHRKWKFRRGIREGEFNLCREIDIYPHIAEFCPNLEYYQCQCHTLTSEEFDFINFI